MLKNAVCIKITITIYVCDHGIFKIDLRSREAWQKECGLFNLSRLRAV